MDTPIRLKVTPMDFFLWFGAMLALYVSVVSVITLFFQYIDTAYPDPLVTYTDPYSGSIRFAIASLIVLFPLFLVLMRVIRKDIIKVPEKKNLWVRHWVLYITLFIAGVTIATDLVMLINTYLGGDISMRFIMKALVVLLIAGAGFLHFLADVRGYWNEHPDYAQRVGWAVALLILATVVSGFFIIGSPWQIRLNKYDDQKVTDLQNIQRQLVNYWQQKSELPKDLKSLQDPISGNTLPFDPQTGESYKYEVLGANAFKLCATFNAASRENLPTYQTRPMAEPSIAQGADLAVSVWIHGVGETCFDRSIDPERYPPFPKGTQVK